MAVLASFTMTMLIEATVGWAFQQSGNNTPVGVLFWVLSPTTFFLSATVLEYIEDGNIIRSLKVSLFYTGFAALLIIVLYSAAAMATSRHRLVRYQRPLLTTERAAPASPSIKCGRARGPICLGTA
jgi:hypothetical protein